MDAAHLRRLLWIGCLAWMGGMAVTLAPSVIDAAEVVEDDDPYARAIEHYTAGRWQQAADACGEYLRRHPDDAVADAWRMQGSALLVLGRYAEALPPIERYLKEQPTGEAARVSHAQRAICLVRLKKFAEAREAYASLEKLEPADDLLVPTCEVLAESALAASEHDWAQSLYGTLADDRHPAATRAKGLLGLAQSKLQAGSKAEALALYQRLEKEFPQLPERDTVLYNRAWLERSLGHESVAREQFSQLHAEFPQSRYWPDAVYRLAEAALADKDYAQAEMLATELLRSEPTAEVVPHARYLLAQTAIAQGKWDKVSQQLTSLLKDTPEDPLALSARYWQAEAAYRLKDNPLASERFATLAELAKDTAEPWAAFVPLRRSQIALQLKKWRDAESFAHDVAKDYPQCAELHEADYVLGRSLSAQGRFDEARDAYARVLASTNGAKTETAAMAQWMTGESYFHQKNYPVAIREYLKLEVLHDFPTWKAGSLLQAGKCHEQLGERAQAIELYTRLLKQYPDTPFATEASGRLKFVEQQSPPKR